MKKETLASVLLGTILEMSDHAAKMGGATSISGVAALHRMQTSIQKNRNRIVQMLQDAADQEKADG